MQQTILLYNMYSKYLCYVQTEIKFRGRTEEVRGKVLMCEDCSSAHWAENCVQLQTLHCSSTIYWVLLCGTIFLCVQLYSTIFLRFLLCSIAQYFWEFTLLYSSIYNTLLQLRYSPPYCSILYIGSPSHAMKYIFKVLLISHCNIIFFFIRFIKLASPSLNATQFFIKCMALSYWRESTKFP